MPVEPVTGRRRVAVGSGCGLAVAVLDDVAHLDPQVAAAQCRSTRDGASRRPCLMALVSISWSTR